MPPVSSSAAPARPSGMADPGSTAPGRRPGVDVLGMWTSALCLVHCLAAPLLLTVSAASLGHEYELLDYLFLCVATLAGLQASRRALPITRVVLLLGVALFALSFGLHELGGIWQYAHVPGSLLLLAGHWQNLRRRGCAVR